MKSEKRRMEMEQMGCGGDGLEVVEENAVRCEVGGRQSTRRRSGKEWRGGRWSRKGHRGNSEWLAMTPCARPPTFLHPVQLGAASHPSVPPPPSQTAAP